MKNFWLFQRGSNLEVLIITLCRTLFLLWKVGNLRGKTIKDKICGVLYKILGCFSEGSVMLLCNIKKNIWKRLWTYPSHSITGLEGVLRRLCFTSKPLGPWRSSEIWPGIKTKLPYSEVAFVPLGLSFWNSLNWDRLHSGDSRGPSLWQDLQETWEILALGLDGLLFLERKIDLLFVSA